MGVLGEKREVKVDCSQQCSIISQQHKSSESLEVILLAGFFEAES